MSKAVAADLRDLAKQIRDLTRGHRAYSSAWPIIQVMCNHLDASATVSEYYNGDAGVAPKARESLEVLRERNRVLIATSKLILNTLCADRSAGTKYKDLIDQLDKTLNQ